MSVCHSLHVYSSFIHNEITTKYVWSLYMKRCVRYGHQNVPSVIRSISLLGFEQTLDCEQIKSGKNPQKSLFYEYASILWGYALDITIMVMRNPNLSVPLEVLASWKMTFPLSDFNMSSKMEGKSYFLASGHMVYKKINLDHHEAKVLWSFLMACKVTLSILCRPNCSILIRLPRWSLQRYSGLVMAFIDWYWNLRCLSKSDRTSKKATT